MGDFLVSFLLVSIFLCGCFGEEITFNDDDGGFFTLRIYEGCYTFKPDLVRHSTSAEIENGCFQIFKNELCQGEEKTLTKGTYDLKDIGFHKAVSSVKLCSSKADDIREIILEHPPNHHMRDRKPLRRNTEQEIRDAAVNEHNLYRRLHGVPDVRGNQEMHEDAQKWADFLSTSNRFEATTMGKYGNNIATSFKLTEVDAIKDAVKRWYDRGNETHNAILWRATTDIGIGVTWSNEKTSFIVVAFYSPSVQRSRYNMDNSSENSVEPLTQEDAAGSEELSLGETTTLFPILYAEALPLKKEDVKKEVIKQGVKKGIKRWRNNKKHKKGSASTRFPHPYFVTFTLIISLVLTSVGIY